jgi:two-component system, chemotaxis family, chemotaxis protein CheY
MHGKIMVVDDSRTIRHQVGIVLAPAGYEIVEAEDGIQGCEKIAAHPDVAMILCDINMPRMDGLQMLALVKEGGKNADLPVVMLTTEGQPALVARAKAAGAKGWLVKPFKPELLLATVRKLARMS